MLKTGILGGTFDPIHTGHIECALKIKKEFGLDNVIILPAGNPPHKFARPVTPGTVRLELAELAVSGIDGLSVSGIEVNKKGYTFTADTLSELAEKSPGTEFYYILGDDSAAGISGWKDAEKLGGICSFILVRRQGSGEDSFQAAKKALEGIDANVLFSKETVPEISSTKIREAFSKGLIPEGGIVPEKVSKVILERGLYKEWPMSEASITEDLRSVLPEKRFRHSLGVSEEAVRLAEKYGADKDKARLAGLLHDCAKGVTIPQLKWIGMTMEDFSPEPADGFSYRVLHGPLGAVVAERRYGVTDPEVLSAISKHTTGGKSMSLLDLVDSVGLVPAIAFACDEVIKIILKRGEPIDVRTVHTRNAAIADLLKGKKN